MVPLVERFTRYLLRVECRYCGTLVYLDEDEARDNAEHWRREGEVRTIDDLRNKMADRVCDGCDHMLDRDD